MIQKIIQVLAKQLTDIDLSVGKEYIPVEIATEVVNALHVTEEGWLCPNRPHRVVALPDCDECYPVFRLREVEGVDRPLPGEVQDL